MAGLDLNAGDRELLLRAQQARLNAYAPYSGFSVGAALRTRGGAVYAGANMENASYGLTMCAEVAALTAATTGGDLTVDTIAIVGGPEGGLSDRPTTPCGRCRQLIVEAAMLGGSDTRILAANADLSRISQYTISELLPEAFGPGDLSVQK